MLARGGVTAVVLLAALASRAWAADKPILEALAAAPDWVREAAARQVPGSLDGVDTLVLHDETIVRPLETGGVRLTHRWALRVLEPEGMDDAASAAVPHRKDDTVESLAAWNVLPAGGVRRPHPKDDVADLPYTAGVNAVDDVRLRTLNLPGVMVGSVAAFEYVLLEGLDRGAHGETFGSVDAPVGACRLTLEAPAGWALSSHALRAESFAREESPGRLSFSVASLAPPPREDWAPADEDRLPRVWVSWRSPDGKRGFRDWNDVARWYRELAEPVLKDAGEAASIAARLKPADAAASEKALRDAFAFASRDVRYVSIQMGIGGFKPQPPSFTCANRYGDCKAKSFLVRSLVEPWGWHAYPVLVLTSNEGRVVPEVPTPGQFNHCIAAVSLPDGLGEGAWNVRTIEGAGRVAFLDPTTTHLGPWQLPQGDQGTMALLVLPGGGRLVELPTQPAEESRRAISLRATLDERGQVVEGRLAVEYAGTLAGGMRSSYEGATADQVKLWVQRRLQGWVPGASLVEHLVTGLESVDAPVSESFSFKGGRLGQRAAEMLIVQAPALALPVPSARLPPPPRLSRLELGLPEETRVEVQVQAPAGWVPEALPAPARHEAPWLSLDCAWERSETGYAIRATGRQLASAVEAADYVAFREAARKASGIESEGVVLVKAAAP